MLRRNHVDRAVKHPLVIGVVVAFAAIIAASAPASAGPIVRRGAGGVPVAVTQLIDRKDIDQTCNPASFRGRVAARSFDQAGTGLSSITVEAPNGSRDLINVDPLNDLSSALQSLVADALQRLSKVGRPVVAKGFRCGASGHVVSLDAIQ